MDNLHTGPHSSAAHRARREANIRAYARSPLVERPPQFGFVDRHGVKLIVAMFVVLIAVAVWSAVVS